MIRYFVLVSSVQSTKIKEPIPLPTSKVFHLSTYVFNTYNFNIDFMLAMAIESKIEK